VREVLICAAVLLKSSGCWNSVGMLSLEDGVTVVNGAEYSLRDSSRLKEKSL
jgi:hypothetical protein